MSHGAVRVVVCGGGAAGMMAALFAARGGAETVLLDRNEKLGKKLYITGKGRCNLTNDCDRDAFLSQVPRNPRFLYSALDFFSPRDMMSLMESAGCPVEVQRGRRVFPASEKASDVTRTLSRLLDTSGVRILLRSGVSSLLLREGRCAGVRLEDGRALEAGAVILATGGKSYPSTGSTGDGYRLAAEAGHTVLSPSPVLVGLETGESWPGSLQGLSLKNVELTVLQGRRQLYRELGEMLFTHFGISGPLALEASCHLPDKPDGVRLSLDLKPGLSREQLDARLRREFAAGGKKQFHTVLPLLLPSSLAALFPDLCGIPRDTHCSQITGAQREALLSRLKALEMTLKAPRPLEEAVVTRGGVKVGEVNPKTMESKIMPGLYFAGELLDVDAHTGGYNLQIAWSTGALAGSGAARRDEI